ncbi:uncharacterized protein LOC113768709 [Coffea eugenioides]|uniref:uncharacterized protein LOC113768709 n=1 Tax=Coffea eugenioides TaxID=49369 RepID=UPI000F6076C7|nr:uncharacterized protein LOC113768709 [Coffea eugenioides]
MEIVLYLTPYLLLCFPRQLPLLHLTQASEATSPFEAISIYYQIFANPSSSFIFSRGPNNKGAGHFFSTIQFYIYVTQTHKNNRRRRGARKTTTTFFFFSYLRENTGESLSKKMYSNGDSSSPEDSNGESNEKAQRSIRGLDGPHWYMNVHSCFL